MPAKNAFFSYETRIGILAIVSIVLLIWGYTYLKGRNILSSSTLMYVEYSNVDMLANSAPVIINGYQVGVVADIYLKPDDMQKIIVVLDIKSAVSIPKNAIAEIISTDVMGGKGIRLSFSGTCSGDDCAKNGDYLEGRVTGLLGSIVSPDELERYLNQVTGAAGVIWDTLENKITDPDAKGISESIRNFNALTANLNVLVLGSSKSIENTMAHLSSIMAKIDEDNEKISAFLTNVAAFSEQLNTLELDKTMDNLNGTMTTADSAMVELKKTLHSAKGTLANISGLIDGIKQGEGTIGKLITNDSLYYNLNNTSLQLEILLKDIEEKPYRYMPLKSRNKVNRYDKKDGKQ